MGLFFVGDEACGDEALGAEKLRREDHIHVRHDSVFSNWAMLVGPFDWEDHHLGKEGIHKYRIHNLPLSCSGPGLYELGIIGSHSISRHHTRKLKYEDIVVVYLGQADNVRTRLQHYGRDGSHLEGNNLFFLAHKGGASSHQHSNDGYLLQGPRLFTEVFSRGFSIVFRWTIMSTKAQAERTEARLLKVFDYAWNRGGNGARRPHDVLLKLEKLSSQKLTHEWNMTLRNIRERKWILFGKNAAGIMIDGKKPTKAKQSNQGGATLRNNFGPFSLTRNRIRLVSMKGSMEKTTLNADENTCNVALGDGSICVATPVKGRKRSPDHKGQKGINVKNHIEASNVSTAAVLRHQAVKEHTDEKRHCGVPLDDGSLCKILPDKGRKRCNIHKGMRAPIRTI